MKRSSAALLLAPILLLLFGTASSIAQLDSVGGPYVADEHTMLLLHFDGDYKNYGQSADGVPHGKAGTQIFLPSFDATLGQCLYLVNDAISDSAYVTVPDTSTLDLKGNWTMEGWIYVLTFGAASSDHRWVPRLLIKTGDEVFWRPNYFVELWGDRRFFSCGYNAAGTDLWPQANSPDNVMAPGMWVHLTFIRDTTRQFIATMVHDANRKLISYSSYSYDPVLEAVPIQTNQPVSIGFAGGGNDSWLDGFVDEIRISDVIRNFAVPPIMGNVTVLGNQPSSAIGYEVQGRMFAFAPSATISKAVIRYNDGSGWAEEVMTPGADNIFTGSIPSRPAGTRLKYYVYAEDSNGLSATVPTGAPDDTTAVYRFVVYQPNTVTLSLSFDDGPGNKPVDGSIYNSEIITFRPTEYSTDAKQGLYSLLLDNANGRKDSNWVEVNSPFLSGAEFTVDVWFKPDSIRHGTRVVNLPSDPTVWNENNYEISFRTKPLKPGTYVTARYWATRPTGHFLLSQDTAQAKVGQWYHVIFERNAANKKSGFSIRDANDNLVFFQALTDSTPIQGGAPLRVGRAATSTTDWWYIPPFSGKIDNLVISNYPAAGTVGVEEQPLATLPHEFRLDQNYPNPFNPTTSMTFSVPKSQQVSLVVYDLLGRRVRTLINEELHAGDHGVTWNGTNDAGRQVGSGVYFYRLQAGDRAASRSMLFLK